VTGCGKVNSRVCRVIGISGLGIRSIELLDIVSGEIAIRKVSNKKGRSALTIVRSWGLEGTMLDH
jgi:hypothetical protein